MVEKDRERETENFNWRNTHKIGPFDHYIM